MAVGCSVLILSVKAVAFMSFTLFVIVGLCYVSNKNLNTYLFLLHVYFAFAQYYYLIACFEAYF